MVVRFDVAVGSGVAVMGEAAAEDNADAVGSSMVLGLDVAVGSGVAVTGEAVAEAGGNNVGFSLLQAITVINVRRTARSRIHRLPNLPINNPPYFA